MNNQLQVLNEEKLMNTEGGVAGTVMGVTGLLIAGYGLLREVVREAGKQAGYREKNEVKVV